MERGWVTGEKVSGCDKYLTSHRPGGRGYAVASWKGAKESCRWVGLRAPSPARCRLKSRHKRSERILYSAPLKLAGQTFRVTSQQRRQSWSRNLGSETRSNFDNPEFTIQYGCSVYKHWVKADDSAVCSGLGLVFAPFNLLFFAMSSRSHVLLPSCTNYPILYCYTHVQLICDISLSSECRLLTKVKRTYRYWHHIAGVYCCCITYTSNPIKVLYPVSKAFTR